MAMQTLTTMKPYVTPPDPPMTDPQTASEPMQDASPDPGAMPDGDAAPSPDQGKEKARKPKPRKAAGQGAKAAKNDQAAHDGPVDGQSPSRPIGTAKGIETLFRNAYLAETELIALAATKANIMISLNGFIVSALMISGAFIYASSPAFLVPAGMFLFTAALSIYFALLAASPELIGMPRRIFNWLMAVLKRKARLRDFRAYTDGSPVFIDGVSNLLLYEDRAKLTKEAYWTRMRELLRDQDEIYKKMSEQLYWLGEITSKKFEMLKASYSVFRWGLTLSVILFLSVKSFEHILDAVNASSRVGLRSLALAQFEDIYEPSGLVQLPDGRLLVVEDESKRAFSLLNVLQDGTLIGDEVMDIRVIKAFGRKLDDLEALTMDAEGYIYAITSHSRTEQGKRQPDREQLVRFRIKGNSVVDVGVYGQLTDHILGSRVVSELISRFPASAAEFKRANIEGMTFDRATKSLLIGFRDPVIDGKSLILRLENPEGLFNRGEPPRFSDSPILLDLQGGGVRALTFDPVLGGFLIVNEIVGHAGKTYSQLWSWSGKLDAAPQPVALPGIVNLNNVESIGSIRVDGEPRLIIMSDEGDAKKQDPAKYMMLEYSHLLSRG